MELRISKRVVIIGLAIISILILISLTPQEALITKTKHPLNTAHSTSTTPINTYGIITNKVALITDTQYTKKLIPLILHFHSVLGPDWPIVFYTSQATSDKHFAPETAANQSVIWQRAVSDRRIDVRILPSEVDLTRRNAVNLFLARPWLWEQLAPAQHVLIFQADSMICANSHRRADDWLKYDFVGPSLSHIDKPLPKFFNGGLSLRNRTMILDILNGGHNWEKETEAKTWTRGGEDMWFSYLMGQRGANLPDTLETLQFACQFDWHLNMVPEPLGYHKVHVNVPFRMNEIARWCPEIALSAKGTLEPA